MLRLDRNAKIGLAIVAGVFTAYDLYRLYKDLKAPSVKKGSIRYLTKQETSLVNADLALKRAIRRSVEQVS